MRQRLELAIGLDVPARARRWILSVCDSFDLPYLSQEAALLVNELVTNAVVHARTDCVVIAETQDLELLVEVIDNAGNLADVQLGAGASSAERGRGLLIVAGLAAAWGVRAHPDGKSVWFTLRTAQAEDVAHAATPGHRD